MGKKDSITKDYTNDKKVFADAFNYLLHDGVQKIKEEDLTTYDSTEIGVIETENGKTETFQVFRDGLNCLNVKEDESAIYVLLGIEDQSDVHYAMPVKNMTYDALDYHSQVRRKAQEHRAEKERMKKLAEEKGELQNTEEKETANPVLYKTTSGEFLSGFYKTDKLIPVVTLAVYFGAEKWDGPRSLHEMFPDIPKEILDFVPDYKINLISPADMTDDEIDKFRSSLREVLLFIKYSKNKEILKEKLKEDKRFQLLDESAMRVISTVTGTRIKKQKKGENGNVCQAIDEMMEDARQEGWNEAEMKLKVKPMIKKIKKGYSLERIAEDLEETEEALREMYNIILKYGPDYPLDQIGQETLHQA